MAKVKTQKYLSKNCQDTLERYVNLSESLPNRMDAVRPELLINTIRNNGGRKPMNMILNSFAVLTTSYTNSLLMSSAMVIANVASAFTRNYEALMGFTIRNFKENQRGYSLIDARRYSSAIGDTMGAFAVLFGKNNQLVANQTRYFLSAMKTGIASDVTRDVNYLARATGMGPETLRKEAKRLYVESWGEAHKFKDEADKQRFADSINLSDEEVARFFTDVEYMLGNASNLPKFLRFIGTPTKLSIAIDESTKVYYRMLKVSDLARRQALKDSLASGGKKKIDELHAQYFKETINVHNKVYSREFNLANQLTENANFRGVRQATRFLEAKVNRKFYDIFPKEDIPYEAVREFALGMTFQRRLGDEPGKLTIPGVINSLNLLKSRTGTRYSAGQNIAALGATLMYPFVKTPYNIYVDGLLYTPMAFSPWFRPSIWKIKKDLSTATKRKTGATKIVEEPYEDWQAKALIGGLPLAAIAMGFSLQDDEGYPYITGTPHSAEERRRWQQLGIPEKSIRWGDTYIPFKRFEPIGGVLGLYVDWADALLNYYKEDEFGYDPNDTSLFGMLGPAETRLLDELAYSIYAQMTTAPILEQGVKLIEMFKYDTATGLEDVATAYGKGFIPTASSDIARMIDDNERIALTFSEKLQQRLPILREKLAVNTQQFEGATTKDPNWFEIVTKMDFVPINASDVQIQIHDTEANIPVVDARFLGVELDSQSLSILRQITKPFVERALGTLVESNAYLREDQPRRKRLLESYAARASHPFHNKELTAMFFDRVQRELGDKAVKNILDQRWNKKIAETGTQGRYFQFIELVGE